MHAGLTRPRHAQLPRAWTCTHMGASALSTSSSVLATSPPRTLPKHSHLTWPSWRVTAPPLRGDRVGVTGSPSACLGTASPDHLTSQEAGDPGTGHLPTPTPRPPLTAGAPSVGAAVPGRDQQSPGRMTEVARARPPTKIPGPPPPRPPCPFPRLGQDALALRRGARPLSPDITASRLLSAYGQVSRPLGQRSPPQTRLLSDSGPLPSPSGSTRNDQFPGEAMAPSPPRDLSTLWGEGGPWPSPTPTQGHSAWPRHQGRTWEGGAGEGLLRASLHVPAPPGLEA